MLFPNNGFYSYKQVFFNASGIRRTGKSSTKGKQLSDRNCPIHSSMYINTFLGLADEGKLLYVHVLTGTAVHTVHASF